MLGLQELQARNPELVIVGVATKSDPKAVKEAIEKNNLKVIHMAISDPLAQSFNVQNWPVTVIIDGEGRIRFLHTSAPPDVVGYFEKDLATMRSPEAEPAGGL